MALSNVRRDLIGGAVALAAVAGATGAAADDFTVGGAFSDGLDRLQIEFSHGGGPLTTFTSQWGRETNPHASPPLDGFDVFLALFDGTGSTALLLASDDDGCTDINGNVLAACSRTIGGTPFTGGARDTRLDFTTVAAGTYTLVLSAFANQPDGPTLGDGYDGNVALDTPDAGFVAPSFRVHLLGIDQILNVQSPNPVSISGPFTSPDA